MIMCSYKIKFCILILFISILLLLLSTCTAYPEDFGKKLDKAFDFIETGKPDSAAVILYDLQDIIEDKNDRVRALYYLSLAMNQLGSLGEEIQYLIMAREESGESEIADKIDLAYSRILLKTGNFDDCISIVNEFRLRYPYSAIMPDMLYIAGNAYFSTGRYRRAFNIFSEITKNYENIDVSTESIMKEGLCLYKLDLIGGAIERFELYLTKNTLGENTPDALYFLGLCYESTRRLVNSIEVFKRLVIEYSFYPKVMDTYFKLGEINFATGRFPEAKNAFLNYIANTDKKDVKHNEALLNLERIAFKRGRYASEIAIYENFVTKYPDSPLSPKMLFDLARYYKIAGKIDGTFEKYKILMTNPIYSAFEDSAAFLMADTYFSIEKKNEAVSFLRSMANVTSDSVRTQNFFLKIASLYENSGDYEAAVAWYDSSFALEASQNLSIKALIGIGRIFKKIDRWMDSGKTYERIITDYSDNPYIKDVYLALSEIYSLEGRLKIAALTAEKAVKYAAENEKPDILLYIADLYEEIDENHALRLYSIIFNNNLNTSSQISEALLKYGDIAFKIGDRESAIKAYATVINNDTDSVLVSRAREKLDFIHESKDDSINDVTN